MFSIAHAPGAIEVVVVVVVVVSIIINMFKGNRFQISKKHSQLHNVGKSSFIVITRTALEVNHLSRVNICNFTNVHMYLFENNTC